MLIDRKFLDDNFTRIRVPGLGDCFYEMLRLYGRLYNIPSLNRSVKELRTDIYDAITEKRNTEEYSIALTGITNLSKIKEEKQWRNEANIVAIELAYDVFNVNIFFYNLENDQLNIQRYPREIDRNHPTIHALRSNNNHFDLLIPKIDPISHLGSSIRNKTKSNITEKYIGHAADIMQYPEANMISKNASDIIYQKILNMEQEPAFAQNQKKEAENYAKKVAQENINAELALRIAQENTNAEYAKKQKKDAENYAKKVAQEKANAELARRNAQEKANAELARRLAQENVNAELAAELARRLAQENRNAEYAKHIAAHYAQEKGGKRRTQKRHIRARRTKKNKNRNIKK